MNKEVVNKTFGDKKIYTRSDGEDRKPFGVTINVSLGDTSDLRLHGGSHE